MKGRYKKLWLFAFWVLPLILTAGGIKLNDRATGFFKVEHKSGSYTLGASLGEIYVSTVRADSAEYNRIFIKGFHVSMDEGMPEVPVMNKFIEVPFGGEVTVKVVNSDEKIYTSEELGINYRLYPHQPSQRKNTPPVKLILNRESYQRNEFSGKPLVRIIDEVVARGKRMVLVQYSPLDYNPVSGEIKVSSNVIFELNVKDPDLAETYYKAGRFNNVYYSSLLQQVALGDEIDVKSDLSRNPVNYLIFCADEFTDNAKLAEFIAWKEQKGFNVTLVSLSEAGGTAEGIKNYIQNAYDNDPVPPSFVLLIGDYTNMPTNDGDADRHVTDNKYVMVDGDDDVIDIYIGRFSAESAEELEAQIDKTLLYEQFTMDDPSYLDEMMGTAGWDSDYAESHGYPQINYFDENYATPEGWTFYKYLSASSQENVDEIIGHFSDGVAFYNYTAHCSPSGLYDPSFTISDIATLENDGQYALLLANCCESNQFANSTDCFGEVMLYTPNKGAIGYIGGTNYTYWDEDLWYGVGYYANITGTGDAPPYDETGTGAYDGVMREGYITNAGMNYAGQLAVAESGSSLTQYYWEIYNLMGDPSVATYWGVPQHVSAVYSDIINLGESSFSISVPGYENALVALTLDGNSLAVDYTDSEGNLTLYFDELLNEGEMILTVTGQNLEPIIDTINIVRGAEVTFNPSSVTVNTATDVSAHVVDLDGNPIEGINVWAEGIEYTTDTVVTDGNGDAVISVSYPYGPALTVYGRREGESYNLFQENLPIDEAFQFTSTQLSVENDVELTTALAVDFANEITVVADPAFDFFTYELSGDSAVKVNGSSSVVLTPVSTGSIIVTVVKEGYNVSTDTLDVIMATGTISGTVSEEGSGEAVTDAEVQFFAPEADPEIDEPLFTAVTDPYGFYEISEPQPTGYYTVYVNKFGYEKYIMENYLLKYSANENNIALTIATQCELSGTVTNHAGTPIGASVKLFAAENNELYGETACDSYGHFSITLITGDYIMQVSADEYITSITDISVTGNQTVDVELREGYSEDFESDNGGYTEDGSLWQFGQPDIGGTISGINVWATNLSGNYTNSADASLYSEPILLEYQAPTLKFFHWYSIEKGTGDYDGGNVKISVDGGETWNIIIPVSGYNVDEVNQYNEGIPGEPAFSGELPEWEEVEFDLSEYYGEEVIIRWHFGSNASTVKSGWYIDNVTIEYDDPTVSEDPVNIVYQNVLYKNYPNPFNPVTTIPYAVKKVTEVKIVIYNMLGQKIRTFSEGVKQPGTYSVKWDATDNGGIKVPSGIYIYRMEAGSFSMSRKLLLLK